MHTAEHICRVARDFRAQFWSREFEHLNHRRFTWVGAGLALNLVLLASQWSWSSQKVVTGYVVWLLCVAAFEGVRRLLESRNALLIWSTAACVTDAVFVTVLMHLAGGGWWIGVPFYGIVVAIAATALPRRCGFIVFISTLVLWTVLLALPAVGLGSKTPLFGLADVNGNIALLVNAYSLGMLALTAIWFLLRTQMGRTRRTLESYRRMVEASPYATFTMGPDGRVREANPAALHLMVLSAEEIVGRELVQHVTDETQKAESAAFIRAQGGEISGFEAGFVRGDGDQRWFSVVYSPVDSGSGEQSVLAIARDLTTERNATLANAQLQAELAESRRMQLVGRLVSGVAHELNNPLAAVMSFTEQLLAESSDADSQHALSIVHAQAARARAIVRDLLQVVRDRGERARCGTDLAELLHKSADALQHVCADANVSVDVRVHGPRRSALVDASGIAQVLDNVLRNAVLASPSGGTITAELVTDADGWRISIEDEGDGVPDEVRAHLFEPFFTTRAPGEGTGLGLAVSQGIVEQHGGTLTLGAGGSNGASEHVSRAASADQARKVGARFIISLPASLADLSDPAGDDHGSAAETSIFTASPIDTNEQESLRMSNSPLLLLIEDEAPIRQALQRFLTRRGWTVELCATGLEGRDRLMEPDPASRFDAILCDFKMPGMSGIELYQHIEEHRPHLLDRLIFATGDVASHNIASFLETVNCPVLEKPFPLASLAELLESVRARSTDVMLAATSQGDPLPTYHQ